NRAIEGRPGEGRRRTQTTSTSVGRAQVGGASGGRVLAGRRGEGAGGAGGGEGPTAEQLEADEPEGAAPGPSTPGRRAPSGKGPVDPRVAPPESEGRASAARPAGPARRPRPVAPQEEIVGDRSEREPQRLRDEADEGGRRFRARENSVGGVL